MKRRAHFAQAEPAGADPEPPGWRVLIIRALSCLHGGLREPPGPDAPLTDGDPRTAASAPRGDIDPDRPHGRQVELAIGRPARDRGSPAASGMPTRAPARTALTRAEQHALRRSAPLRSTHPTSPPPAAEDADV